MHSFVDGWDLFSLRSGVGSAPSAGSGLADDCLVSPMLLLLSFVSF